MLFFQIASQVTEPMGRNQRHDRAGRRVAASRCEGPFGLQPEGQSMPTRQAMNPEDKGRRCSVESPGMPRTEQKRLVHPSWSCTRDVGRIGMLAGMHHPRTSHA